MPWCVQVNIWHPNITFSNHSYKYYLMHLGEIWTQKKLPTCGYWAEEVCERVVECERVLVTISGVLRVLFMLTLHTRGLNGASIRWRWWSVPIQQPAVNMSLIKRWQHPRLYLRPRYYSSPTFTLSSSFCSKKNMLYIKNILDIPTKPIWLCSSPSPPLNMLQSIFLAPLLAEIAYLAMLFILQLMHTASSVHRLKNK